MERVDRTAAALLPRAATVKCISVERAPRADGPSGFELQIREKALGPSHPLTATTLEALNATVSF
jgi:hypothetical protein